MSGVNKKNNLQTNPEARKLFVYTFALLLYSNEVFVMFIAKAVKLI